MVKCKEKGVVRKRSRILVYNKFGEGGGNMEKGMVRRSMITTHIK